MLGTCLRVLLVRWRMRSRPQMSSQVGRKVISLPSAVISTGRDVLRVVGLFPLVEFWRRWTSLHGAVAFARDRGSKRIRRTPDARVRLQRVIRVADRRLPGGANCVRRALLEMALDSGAAHERFRAGLRKGGGVGSGHAWLESQSSTERFDAIIEI